MIEDDRVVIRYLKKSFKFKATKEMGILMSI